MQFARGIAFIVAAMVASIYAFVGEVNDGAASGGVILLNVLALAFGWLGARDLWRKARPSQPRRKTRSAEAIDRHLKRKVAAHLRDLERQSRPAEPTS